MLVGGNGSTRGHTAVKARMAATTLLPSSHKHLTAANFCVHQHIFLILNSLQHHVEHHHQHEADGEAHRANVAVVALASLGD